MNEYQEASLNRGTEEEEKSGKSDFPSEIIKGKDDNDSEIIDETQNKEGNLLGHKSRKPFLFVLLALLSLVILVTVLMIYIKSNSVGTTSEQEVIANEIYNPEIRRSTSSGAIQGGELTTADNDEQERLNALAEESRVYCIISSAPYFKDVNSKGSLSISNPKESKYYTQVVIKTEDDIEMYVSPLLAPGEKIESDYLTKKDFEQGTYRCYAYFNYYASEESSSYLGSMCAEINVVID